MKKLRVKTLAVIMICVSLSACSSKNAKSAIDGIVQQKVDEAVNKQVDRMTASSTSSGYNDPVLSQFRSFERRILDFYQDAEQTIEEYGYEHLEWVAKSIFEEYTRWFASLSESNRDRVDDLLEESVAKHEYVRTWVCSTYGSFIKEYVSSKSPYRNLRQ